MSKLQTHQTKSTKTSYDVWLPSNGSELGLNHHAHIPRHHLRNRILPKLTVTPDAANLSRPRKTQTPLKPRENISLVVLFFLFFFYMSSIFFFWRKIKLNPNYWEVFELWNLQSFWDPSLNYRKQEQRIKMAYTARNQKCWIQQKENSNCFKLLEGFKTLTSLINAECLQSALNHGSQEEKLVPDLLSLFGWWENWGEKGKNKIKYKILCLVFIIPCFGTMKTHVLNRNQFPSVFSNQTKRVLKQNEFLQSS